MMMDLALQANHIGRVTVRMEQHRRTPLLDGGPSSARTVLVTGGLGALGILAATWLAERSANLRLVLVGRTGRAARGGATAVSSLLEMMSGAAGGSMFTFCMGDASSAADTTGAFATASSMQPPIQARPPACCSPNHTPYTSPDAALVVHLAFLTELMSA